MHIHFSLKFFLSFFCAIILVYLIQLYVPVMYGKAELTYTAKVRTESSHRNNNDVWNYVNVINILIILNKKRLQNSSNSVWNCVCVADYKWDFLWMMTHWCLCCKLGWNDEKWKQTGKSAVWEITELIGWSSFLMDIMGQLDKNKNPLSWDWFIFFHTDTERNHILFLFFHINLYFYLNLFFI